MARELSAGNLLSIAAKSAETLSGKTLLLQYNKFASDTSSSAWESEKNCSNLSNGKAAEARANPLLLALKIVQTDMKRKKNLTVNWAGS